MFSWYLTRLIIVLLSLFIMSGCGGETDEENSSSNDAPKLSSFFSELDSCILCHSPNGQEADGPDMSTQALFVNSLVGKTKSDYPDWITTSDCSDSLAFIAPKEATKSTLMAALTQEDSNTMQNSSNCTSSFNVHDVNHATIAYGGALHSKLTEWINAGALNN